MSLVAIETLAVRISGTRQSLELRDAALSIVATRKLLQVFANYLIQALAKSFRPFSGALDCLFVDRQCYVHAHSICAPISCVKFAVQFEVS